MADFYFEGIDKSGKQVKKTITAANEGELRMVLRGQGIRPVRIRRGSALNKDVGQLFKFGAPITNQELVIFTRQMQVLINSGIPLLQSLEILTDQSSHVSMRNTLLGIKERVSRGSYLWESMGAYPTAFPKLYVALIRAGESSGSLDQMLKRLARYLEDADRLRKQIKGAMMYPIIVISIGLGVIGVMLGFVIPKFEEMLKGSGGQLPLPTQMVIDTSHFVVNNVLQILGGIVIGSFLVIRYLKTNEGRAFKDRLVFKAPLFGNIVRMGGIARFARTLQTLITSGINLIDAIDICRTTIGNVVLEEATSRIRADIEAGQTLGMSISKIKTFPKMTYQMIQVGESTGNLDKMLEKIADFYEADVEALVGGLSKLIEPIILVFLGTTVGGLMIAMYLPIFKLAGGAGE